MKPRSATGAVESDEQLVARTLAGDLVAYETLVARHEAAVLAVAGRIAGPDDAPDVAQEAFLRAFHRLSRFRGDAPFGAWLLRITRNAALDSLGRRRRETVAPTEAVEAAADGGGGNGRQPAEALEARERADRLRAKLRLLSPQHQQVVVLRDLEGLSYDEIAATTGAPLGSIKGWLHRGRRQLIELLRANTYDWELPDER